MAAQYYVSSNMGDLDMSDPANAGTSGTAGDDLELRIGDGTNLPTKKDVQLFMRQVKRWLRKGGLGAGANLPAI